MSRVEDLLEEILDELKAIRTDVNEIQQVLPIIRPTYDADVHQQALERIADGLSGFEELGDRITGGIGGFGGADLEEVSSKLTTIEINTTPD